MLLLSYVCIFYGIGICKKCRTSFEPMVAPQTEEFWGGDIQHDEIQKTAPGYEEMEKISLVIKT